MARLPTLWVIALLCAAPDASAQCAAGRPLLSPSTGADLPANATLYLFVPGAPEQRPKLRATGDAGARIPLRVHAVTRTEAFSAYTLELDSVESQRVVIEYDGRELARYRISSWRTSNRRAALPQSAKHVSSAWSCSHTDARLITLSGNAPAYRIERSSSNQMTASELAVHPSNSGLFFGRAGLHVIGLGHLSCLGQTTTTEVQDIFYVRVTPLYSDGPGQESPVYGVSATDVWLVTPEPDEPTHVCGMVAPPARSTFPWGILGGTLTIVAFLLFGVVARSRRHASRVAL